MGKEWEDDKEAGGKTVEVANETWSRTEREVGEGAKRKVGKGKSGTRE